MGGATAAVEAAFNVDRRALGILLLANLAILAGYGSFITTYAPFARGSLGWTTTEIGIVFSLFGLGSITIGPSLGAAADRWGRRRVGSFATIPVFLFAVALILALPSLILYPIAILAGGGLPGSPLRGSRSSERRRAVRAGAVHSGRSAPCQTSASWSAP